MKSIKYVEYVRTLPCCICQRAGEPHHVKAVGSGRDRKKNIPEHYSAIPLCRVHHTELHNMGFNDFEKRYAINLYQEVYRHLSQYLMGMS